MKHDQRPDDSNLTCPNCKEGACSVCVDVLRKKLFNSRVCKCKRADHAELVEVSEWPSVPSTAVEM